MLKSDVDRHKALIKAEEQVVAATSLEELRSALLATISILKSDVEEAIADAEAWRS